MKNILLTGGLGYIGSHIAVGFLEKGDTVILFDNVSNTSESVLNHIGSITGKKPIFYKGDLRNKADIQKVFTENKIEIVIHLAGVKAVGESCEKPFYYYENNIIGSINLFEIMKEYRVTDIIFSSSATVYDPSEISPFTEESNTGNTTNPYGTTKLIIENILRDLGTHSNFRVMSLRYFNPIGAHISGLIGENPLGIPNNLLPYIMKVANTELDSVQVFGNNYDTPDGTGLRDYIHVVDLADGHISAVNYFTKKPTDIGFFETINLGTGNATSVLEMIEYARTATKHQIPFKVIDRRAGDIATAYCSPEKANILLGWKAKKTVEQGVLDSWNFIQKQGK